MPLDIVHRAYFVDTLASGNKNYSGVGLSGKAFILYSTGVPNLDTGTVTDQYIHSIGFAEVISSGISLVTQRYCSVRDYDAIGSSDTYRAHGESGIICVLNSGTTAPARKGVMNLVSGGDAFRINYVNINSTTVENNSFLLDVFGGDDVVNAKVGTFEAQSGHGNQTTSGVGFSGNILFLMSTQQASGNLNVLSGLAVSKMVYGFCATPSQQGCYVGIAEDASANADTWRWQRDDRCFLGINNTGGATVQAVFVGFTSDGFTLNWISGGAGQSNIAGQPILVHYLVMKISGNINVGSFNIPHDIANFNTSGTGLSGKWAQMFSWNTGLNNSDSTISNNRITMGGAGVSGNLPTNVSAMWTGSEDGAGNMITARAAASGEVLQFFDEVATGTTSPVMGRYAFSGFHSDGFIINRLTAAGVSGNYSGSSIIFATIGDAISGATVTVDMQRKAFGGANSMQFPSMAMSDFGGHMQAKSDSRAFFGQPKVPQPMINVSGQLLY